MKTKLTLATLAAAVLSASPLAMAQTYNWDGSGSDPVDGGSGILASAQARWTTNAYGTSNATFVSSTTAGASADYVFGGTAGTLSNTTALAFGTTTFNTSNYIWETEIAAIGNVVNFGTSISGPGLSSLTIRPTAGADRVFTFGMNAGSAGNFSNAFTDNGSDKLNLAIGSTTGTVLGTVILSGANTYSGTTTLNALGSDGLKLVIDSDSRLGTAPGSALANSITFNTSAATGSTLRFSESMTLNATRGIEIGRTAIANAGIGVFEVDAGKDVIYNGIIARRTGNTGTNNISISKTGSGTLTLGGSNTYDGSTIFAGGRLVLDYADNTVLANTSTLTGAGGTLEFKGKSTGATTQTLGNVITNASSGVATIELNRNGGAGMAVTVGTLSPSTTRSALFVDLGNNANTFTTSSDLTTVNSRIIVRDGSGRVDFATNNGTSTALVTLNATTDLIAAPAAAHYRLTSNQTLTSSTGIALSLRIDPSASGQVLTLNNSVSNNNYRFASIMFAGQHDFTITLAAGKEGSLGNGGTGATSMPFLLYHYGTGKLTMDAKMAGGFNSATGAGNIELYGTGLIDWTRAASSSGTMTIGGVTLRQGGANGMLLDNTATGLGSGNIAFSNGGILENSGATTITRGIGTGAGSLQWLGDGGFSASGANRDVNLTGGTVTWGTSIGANALLLGSNSSNARVDFQNDVNLGIAQEVREVRVATGVVSGDVDGRLSGVLSGNGGIRKTGDGVLELTNTNTYTGATFVSAGTLLVNGTQSAATGAVSVSSEATLGGIGTVGGATTVQAGGFLSPGNSPGELIFANGLTLAGTYVWELAALSTTGPGTNFDRITLTSGDANITGATLSLSLGSFAPSVDPFWASNQTWAGILNNTGAGLLTGTFAPINNTAWSSLGSFSVSYIGNDADLVWTAIPEPSTGLLLAASLAALTIFRRRRQSA